MRECHRGESDWGRTGVCPFALARRVPRETQKVTKSAQTRVLSLSALGDMQCDSERTKACSVGPTVNAPRETQRVIGNAQKRGL